MTEPQSNDDANKKRAEETKKRLADEKTARDKQHAEHRESMAGVKPTPTQEENDLAASGVHVAEKEPDGSPPDTGGQPTEKRQSEAGKTPQRGAYPTRATTATQPTRE